LGGGGHVAGGQGLAHGGAGGALAGGFNRRDSLRLGVGMISRGEVGLIVASVALRTELIHPSTFSGIVFMVIVATLVTPPLLRLVYRDADATPVDAGATANP